MNNETVEQSVLDESVPQLLTVPQEFQRKEAQQDHLLSEVDRWFAQKDEIVEALQTRRAQLVDELADVESKLQQITGKALVTVSDTDPITEDAEYAEVASDQVKARQRQASRDLNDMAGDGKLPEERLYGVIMNSIITKRPQKLTAIAKKAGVSTSEALNALQTAQMMGLVKRSGVGGWFWQRA